MDRTIDTAQVTAASTLDEARERIAILERELASQSRQRAELVHLVSHELRTPITVISGFCRLLRDEREGRLNEQQHRFVDESLKSCRRLDRFVTDLLEASPDTATPFAIDPSEGDLHEVIAGQLESILPLLDERGMKVEAALYAESPTFRFDARRMEQVVTNLLSNALRYGRDAGVIRVETRSDDEVILVAIEDDGPGIPDDDRQRLFLPYVRGAGREETEGLGIGLAICRRIVLAHGGRIEVDRGTLGGARFTVCLPRVQKTGGEATDNGGE